MQKSSLLVAFALIFAGGGLLPPAAYEADAAVLPDSGVLPQPSEHQIETDVECKLVYVNGEWVWVCTG